MKERLLVIDDEPDFGAFVRRVAENLGFEVEVTTTPDKFKTVYARFNPTVITVDIVMPDVDGLEMLRWLGDQHCAARIVIISGFNPHYAKAAETLAGFSSFSSITVMQKPVSIADLTSVLRGTAR